MRTLAFWSGSSLGENFRYAVEGTPCERVMQNQACFYPSDVTALFPRDQELRTRGIRAYLGVPVLGSAGSVVGHLVVMDVDPMVPPRHSDWILKLFAARAGAEIERREAERVQDRYAQRLETLQEIDRAILAAQSPAEIAAAALHHVHDLVPYFRSSVALFDPETGEGVLHAVETKGEGLGPGTRVAPESFGSLDELRAGNVHTVEDARSIPQSAAVDRLVQTGLCSWVNVPLVAQGELYGTLNVGWDQPGVPSADAIDILREVADSQAVAIRQARLFKELSALQAEMSLARDIHATLVPPVDRTVQQMELFGRSRPSSAMGGDLLDVVEADGRMGLPNQHLPLGMFDNADYGSQTVNFDPGDVFVLLTDGLTEVENQSGEEFGHRQIEALVTEHATASLPELYRLITSAARQFGKQVDDQTLLLVRAS